MKWQIFNIDKKDPVYKVYIILEEEEGLKGVSYGNNTNTTNCSSKDVLLPGEMAG